MEQPENSRDSSRRRLWMYSRFPDNIFQDSSSSEDELLIHGERIRGDSPIELTRAQIQNLDSIFQRPSRLFRSECPLMKKIRKLSVKITREHSEDILRFEKCQNLPIRDKFLVYMLELGKSSSTNNADLICFLKIMKSLPNRVKIMKAIKRLSPISRLSDNIILICLRLLEYKCEAQDSAIDKENSLKQLPYLLENYKKIDSDRYKKMYRNMKRLYLPEDYGISSTLEEKVDELKQKLKGLKETPECITREKFYS
ncbi:unnamed protein product [Moneuplotes crassus]|uniref:Uncharacterized protein n=1 Tax=Euplotes crassus TaxID=5936 RepID=A0AAD1XFC5_EUPCR|nr:unnamed protein product [Moneuplotes crassus]